MRLTAAAWGVNLCPAVPAVWAVRCCVRGTSFTYIVRFQSVGLACAHSLMYGRRQQEVQVAGTGHI